MSQGLMPISEERDMESGWGKSPFLWMAQILLGYGSRSWGKGFLWPLEERSQCQRALAVGLFAMNTVPAAPDLPEETSTSVPWLPVFRMWYWLWPSLFPCSP